MFPSASTDFINCLYEVYINGGYQYAARDVIFRDLYKIMPNDDFMSHAWVWTVITTTNPVSSDSLATASTSDIPLIDGADYD